MKPADPRTSEQFHFDAVDLAANRTGRLSPEQERQFSQMAGVIRTQPKKIYVLLFIAVVAMTVFMAKQPNVPKDQVFIAGGAMLVMLTIIVMITRLNYRRADAMEQLTVLQVEGQPKVYRSTSEGFWIAKIGDVKFQADSISIGIFDQERTYRVFYTRISRMTSPVILSMETLG
jgi:hypothetical protein